MNTVSFRTASWPRSLALAAVLAAVVTSVPASAGERAQAKQLPQVTVNYGDLDLSSDAGALALYKRFAAAARRVCPDEYPPNLGQMQAIRECREQAMNRAVTVLGNEKLAAIHAARAKVA